MKYLLPNQFKKIGAIAAPVGFFLWILMQRGYITQTLTALFGENTAQSPLSYHMVNVVIATFSFFLFLIGMYCLTFSKERIEDEMVQRTRLDSFQFAALIQIITIILGFSGMIIFQEPEGDGGMMLFFIVIVFIFWISFIARFNYILHLKLRQ